jgi:hypothetical protein
MNNFEELVKESVRLRAQLEELVRAQSPAPATQAPASESDAETQAILDKPIGTWTQSEKARIHSEISSVLRDMGR